MNNLWQCHNCIDEHGKPGRDFEADKPVCPECKLDSTLPEYAQFGLIVKRETIHLDPPHKILKGKGSGKRACDGKPAQGAMFTGVAAIVNCPACLRTDAFRGLAETQGLEVTVVEKHDYVLDPTTMPTDS